jgi:rubrerythrin
VCTNSLKKRLHALIWGLTRKLISHLTKNNFKLGAILVIFLSFTKEKMISFLREQIKLEEEIVQSINQILKMITNPVAKGVLKGISLDSLKHAEIYKAAIEVVSFPPALTEEELNQLKKAVKKHIEDEEKAMKYLNYGIEKTRNEKIKFLLESIASDEKRHHELLNKIMDIVVRGETITEDDWWNFLWQGVPFHGAPGG